MANALSTFIKGAGESLPAMTDDQLADALDRANEAYGVSDTSGIQYVTFSGKNGEYTIGKSSERDEDALYLIEPKSFIAGFKCWKGGKPVGVVEWSYFTPERAISVADLEDHGPYDERRGEGWKPLLGFGLVSTDGNNTALKYTTTTISACNAVKDLILEVGSRARNKEPSLPLVYLGAEQFTSRDGDTNWKPTFHAETWVTRPAFAAFFEGEMDLDALVEGEQPKKKRGRK